MEKNPRDGPNFFSASSAFSAVNVFKMYLKGDYNMARIPLIVGNRKMNKTIQETAEFCQLLKEEVAAFQGSSVSAAGQDVF